MFWSILLYTVYIYLYEYNVSLVMRKPAFGVSDQVRLKPACSATEASYSLEMLDLASIGIILNSE